MRNPFRAVAVLAVAGIAALGLAAPATATSGAHYMNATGASINGSGALVVNIDEAGVGQQAVDYALSINVTADFGCVNGGGNHPQASNKETQSSSSTTGFSVQPENGRVRTTRTSATPTAVNFSCPGGQTLVLADVTYTATLTDLTNSVSRNFGPLTRVFFTFTKH